jgi:hypothetical protein
VPLEKYGTPPEVPATVNAGVVVGVATDTMPPVQLTLVTVPTNWSLLVMVKLGYVPVTTVVPAPVSTTIRSGKLLVMVMVPEPLVTVMPVLAVSVRNV